MIPPGVKAVFFDAVGTVLIPDPGAVTVYAAAARRYGLAIDAAGVRERLIEAFRDEESFDEQAGWVTDEERERARWQTIVRRTLPGTPDGCFDELYEHFAAPQAWRVPVDAVTVFAELARRGLRLGLASNYDSRLISVLNGRPELAPLTDHIVISSLIGVRKPGLGFFEHLVSRAGCEPDEVLLVGDDYGNDYVGARSAGLHAVLLDPLDRHLEVPVRLTSLSGLIS